MPLPGVVAAVAPDDVAGLHDAVRKAEALGFSSVIVPVERGSIGAASRSFGPVAARSPLPVSLLTDDPEAGPARPRRGELSLVARHTPGVVLLRAPDDPARQISAFGRLARSADPGLAFWDGLDRVGPALGAVLSRGPATHAALRSDALPSGDYALVTGGAGFIGCNLADRLLEAGETVVVLDSLQRPGVERNLRWLKARHGDRVRAIFADLRDRDVVGETVRGAASVFHLAAQVAVTTSLVDPVADFETNLLGTVILLEAVRRFRPDVPLVFASTNKVYGDLGDVPLVLADGAWLPSDRLLRERGIGETRPLDFHTPYGCSKGAADQYVLDYARSFGLRAVVLRMSCIYGRLQLGTEDQGWVAHFLRAARAGETITLYGDGRQVRDILDAGDAVSAYLAARARAGEVAGRAFNLGGGPENAISLLGLLDAIGGLLGRPVEHRFGGWRQGDQRYFVADARAARAALGLAAPLPWRDGLARLASWLDDGTAAGSAGRDPARMVAEADAVA